MSETPEMKNQYDVIIIGGGPAGLAAAIESSRRGLSSVLLDRNKKIGRKLYATGNGRCNVTNHVMDASCYYDSPFAGKLLADTVQAEGVPLNEWVLRYLASFGIPCVEKNGYYYPMSLQASSVVWALSDAARLSGVTILTEEEAVSVHSTVLNTAKHVSENTRRAQSDNDNTEIDLDINKRIHSVTTASGSVFSAPRLILATGGASQPHLGASDTLLCTSLKKDLTLAFRPLRPVLGPIPVHDIPDELSGVRVQGKLTVPGNGLHSAPYSESGEIQFLTYTLSGIAAFQVSPLVKAGSRIQIDFMERVPENTFLDAFLQQKSSAPDRRLYAFLNGYLPDKLALFMINLIVPDGSKLLLKDTGTETIVELYRKLNCWEVTVMDEVSFDQSQASSGGILTDQIDTQTMEIKSYPGLYVTGELMDVLGKCGGYNISFALRTGYLAGKYAALSNHNLPKG